MTAVAAIPASLKRLWLAAECAAIFLVAPIVMAWLIHTDVVPVYELRSIFAGLFALAALLLLVTPGFRWRALFTGGLVPDWRALIVFTVVTAAVVAALVYWLRPGSMFAFPRYNQDLWLRVLVFYALISVIPQGIIYRALFFARYESLFATRWLAIAAGALAFGLAHLFFMNWVAVSLTTVGGAVFGWAYVEKKSFLFAALLHVIGGWMIWTVGLGTFFYHGAIAR